MSSTELPCVPDVETKATAVPRAGLRRAVRVVFLLGSLLGSLPGIAGPLSYHLVTPCRAFDSRVSALPLIPGIESVVDLTGLCNVPETASAVLVNIVLITPPSTGHLRAYAAGTSVPEASVLNFRAGRTRANNAVVRLPGDGSMQIALRANSQGVTPIHYVFDVSGYLEGDLIAPETAFTSTEPDPTGDTTGDFAFSSEAGASFECRVDTDAFAACTSPYSTAVLSPGSHTFEVRAVDASGNADPTPASWTWTVDTAAPEVTVNRADDQGDPTNSPTIHFTVTFSEAVTGFVAADVVRSGTAAGGTVIVSAVSTSVYDVSISDISSDGTVTASIASGSAFDLAGNGNTVSTSTDNTVVFDSTVPTVTVNQSSEQADPANTTPIRFTVAFSEMVTGFTSSDVLLTGTAGLAGTTTTVTAIDTTSYDVSVSGITSDGTVTASVASDSVLDDAGNGNSGSISTDNIVAYDNTTTTVTVNQSSLQADPVNTTPIHFTVTFSEVVTGFTSSDVVLAGTAGLAGSSTIVTPIDSTSFDVSVSGISSDGTVIATVAGNSVLDLAGNGNAGSTSTDNTVLLDTIVPTVTVNQSTGQADPANTNPINFTATFSEDVSGFTASDIILGGTAGVAAANAVVTYVSPGVYTVAVSGITSDGSVTASVSAGGATDVAGNVNTASTSTDNSVLYEAATPTVTINQAASQPDPGNGSSVAFTVIFSEPVTGFAIGDVTFSGTATRGTPSISGTGPQYTVTIGVSTDGTIIANIAAGAATDAGGNATPAATFTDNSVTRDATAPSIDVRQQFGQNDPTQSSTLLFRVVFSESVAGLTSSDVVITGTGAWSAVDVTGAMTQWLITVTASSDGTFRVTVPAGAAFDAAGNGNTAPPSADNQMTRDTTGPTVTVSQYPGQLDPTNGPSVVFRVAFSEVVNGFEAADLIIGGPAAASPGRTTFIQAEASGAAYMVEFNFITIDGALTLGIADGAAYDGAFNNSQPFTIIDNSITRDTVAPTVTINQAADQPDPTGEGQIRFTVVFSEPVTGFTPSDVASGGRPESAVGVTGSGATYTVTIYTSEEGFVTASINPNAAVDAAGNSSDASTSTDRLVYVDFYRPRVTINQEGSQPDPAQTGPIVFRVNFDRDVTGFTASDVDLSGTATGLGSATKTVTGNFDQYFVSIGGLTNSVGTLTATIPADVALSDAGNGNNGSTSTDNTVTLDIGPASVTINQAPAQTDPAGAGAINFRVVFSKPVTGFDSSDVTISGTAAGAGAATKAITGSGATYNVAVTGVTGSGTLIATVPAGAANDPSNGSSLASTSTDNTVTVDLTPPTVTINQAAGQTDPTNRSTINFAVIFSESVTGLDGNDFTFGGTHGVPAYYSRTVTGGGTTYNLALGGISGSPGTIRASVNAGAATDIVGNTSQASTSNDNTVTFDDQRPSPRITHPGQADPTSSNTIVFSVNFFESVTGFNAADVTLSGTAGIAGATKTVTGGGSVFTVTISGVTSAGTVMITIPENAATDSAGNLSYDSFNNDGLNVVTYQP